MKTPVGTTFFMGYAFKALHGLKGTLTPALLFLVVLTWMIPSQAHDFIFNSSSFSRQAEQQMWASTPQDKKFSVLWAMDSVGESYADQTDESFLFSVSTRAKIKYRLLDRLVFKGLVNMNFRNGRVQSRFGDFVPGGVFLGYGHFDFAVLEDETIMLKVGALSQARQFSPVIMNHRAFPGVEQELNMGFLEDKKLFLNVRARQMIPTSYTFNTELIEKEELPTLMTLKAELSYYTEKLNYGGYVGYFSFNDLPSKVADMSRFTGNTVIGTNATSQFVFGFEGWNAGAFIKYDLSADASLGFAIDVHENTNAPETFNQSQTLRAFASKRLNRDFGIDVSLINYFVESDAAPSYYTPTIFGNTNRKGNMIAVGFEWIPQKVRLSGAYVQAELINADTDGRQYDADFIFINLETSYDSIF